MTLKNLEKSSSSLTSGHRGNRLSFWAPPRKTIVLVVGCSARQNIIFTYFVI